MTSPSVGHAPTTEAPTTGASNVIDFRKAVRQRAIMEALASGHLCAFCLLRRLIERYPLFFEIPERPPCHRERPPCHRERPPCHRERPPCHRERSEGSPLSAAKGSPDTPVLTAGGSFAAAQDDRRAPGMTGVEREEDTQGAQDGRGAQDDTVASQQEGRAAAGDISDGHIGASNDADASEEGRR